MRKYYTNHIENTKVVAAKLNQTTNSDKIQFLTRVTILLIVTFFILKATSFGATFYSYQSGNWTAPSTWTSDPSGTLQIGTAVPANSDIVVILSDRTVLLTANIASTGLDITINSGGYLNLAGFRFTATVLALRGQGTLQLATVNFPTVTTNQFVNAGGGTTEYNNTADFTLLAAQTTYNNLTINTNNFIATQLSNITLNGDLYVKNGTYRINDNTSTAKRTLTINGNVIVDNGAFITVGNGVTNPVIGTATGGTAPFITYYAYFHTVIVKGDFTNNGTVKFTNLAYPLYDAFPPTTVGATSGAASVYFQGLTDNTLTCNGITNFYNLILDKGTDQTYLLTLNSSDYANFKLFGANTIATEAAPTGNPNLRKALWLRNGTLSLSGLVAIPSLSEGTAANSEYYIPTNAALVLDGPDVVVLSTADDYREVNVAYGVSGGAGLVNGIGKGGLSSLYVFGKLQINDGYLSTRESGGIITSSVASGQLVINGGVVDAKQFLCLTGSASFTQTDGTFILRGRFQRTPTAYSSVADLTDVATSTLNTARATNGVNAAYGSFNLNNTTNTFVMTGGTIRIYDVCGIAAAEQEAFDVLSSTANINVTGGTVELLPTTGTVLADVTNFLITSNAPLANLLINRVSSTSSVQLNTYALTVLSNLTLSSGVFTTNNLDVTVGGDFTVENGTTYNTGTNTTLFNGLESQVFTVNLATALSLNKLTIDKPLGAVLSFSGTQTVININDNLRIVKGIVNDNGNTINALKDIYNSGTHGGSGKIVLKGTVAQTISGDGNGVFENIELNNNTAVTAPVSLAANTTINGVLTFSKDKLFNILTYNLKLGNLASIVNAGSLRYIQSSGNSGDGGLTKVYSSSASSFIYPIGVVNYTPSTLNINGIPTAYGSISVVPVNYAHPNVTNPSRSLSYFWKVKSSGFVLGAATLTHGYTYNESNVVLGTEITENEYVAARFNYTTNTWTKGVANDVDETNNIIGEPGTGTFLQNVAFIDGDYTAGDDNSTNPFGTPAIYYSRQSGLWGNTSTWSTIGHTGAAASSVPSDNDIVIIGGQDSVYLATQNTTADFDVRKCASLQIERGSALDIGYNPGCVFGMVISHINGNGNFRLTTSYTDGSTYTFPSGDFSDFNTNLGTTELYSTNPASGTTYWLPNNISSYGNLILSPLGGSNIIFPNLDLTILGNLITRGENADSWFCPAWDSDYPTAPLTRVAKTITIKGNMDLQSGGFIWYGNAAITQNVVVEGNVTVAAWSALYVYSGATSQNMSIGGSLINNTMGVVGGGASSTTSKCDFTNLPLTFFGADSASITNTSGDPLTIFTKVTVNKGNSQITTLTCDIAGTLTTPTDNWLTIQSGTFRYMRSNPATDFTISQATVFTIPQTGGLYIDYSNSSNKNVLIADKNNNASDLILNGKLTVVNGSVYVGPINGTTANNNDIEYSGSGFSTIEIQGGRLIVNGQIRTNTSTTNGVLKYIQSGGALVINGQSAVVGYAKLGVLNAGSIFNMSGGTITIVRGGGTTFGDLYLRPASSSVTGGEIIFTQVPAIGPVVDAAQTYKLDANVLLNNLTITGKTAAAARNATLTLMVSPLVLNGTLTINNANSILVSNNKNITINGDLVNNGTYTYGTNNTIFSGATQVISGTTTTNFYDLTVSPVTSLSVNNSFTVNRNLTVNTGSFILANKKVTLKGNFINNGSYTDDNTIGGVSLNGTSQQQITGTGAYGRLELNNSTGAKLNNDIMLQNDLVLTLGNLTINSYLLTLSQNSIISGAPFGTAKMIVSDGVLSSLGLRKFFTTTPPASFVFPVGVSGKYTPATYTITSNGAVGYINVNPINNNHPSVLDPLNVLKYYWQIESSGISGFNATLLLAYVTADIKGTEANYVAAKLENPGNYWTKASPGAGTDNVNEGSNLITFNSSNSSNLSGDYTAGIDAAIPDEVPAYQSNQDGNWSNAAIWTPVGSAPPCPVGGPNGCVVIIDHVVTATNNYCFAYRTNINNKLVINSSTIGHNLGYVEGSGILFLQNGTLPGGNYTTFFDCASNGTVEYSGNTDYTIVATQFNSLPNISFTGTGTRTLPNKDLTICNKLIIDGPTLDNSVNRKKLTIMGSMERYNTGAFKSGTGVYPLATISFAGSSAQSIGGVTGDFTGTNSLCNLEINNSDGLSIGENGLVEVSGILYLTNGLVNTTSSNKLSITNTATAAVSPVTGSATSYVNGPLVKQIVNNGNFLFPLGKGTLKAHNLTLTSKAGFGINRYWTAEFFTPNSTATSVTAPLQASNTKEYWTVSTTDGRNANVKISWDASSDLTAAMTSAGMSDMRIAEYNTGTSSWTMVGTAGTTTTTGAVDVGDVTSSANVSINTTAKKYTTASISITKPRAQFAVATVCGTTGIPVTFTSFAPISLNYTLNYTIDGVVQPAVTVTALPYTLPALTAGVYRLTGFSYNNGVNTGVVDNGTVNVYATPTPAAAGIDQSLCGSSGTTLVGNSPSVGTGVWSIISGSGGTLVNNTLNNTVFTGILGQSYTLKWTISNATCTSSDNVVVAFPVAAARPSNFISAPINLCKESTYTYTVPNVAGSLYTWTYSGTGVTIPSTTSNSVAIYFGASATIGTLSVTASNACGTSAARSVDITAVNARGIWLGTVNTDWFNVNNWSCPGLPTSTTNVFIYSGLPNYPVIGAAGAVCKSITIDAGASLTINGSNNFDVYGNWTNNNTFVANDNSKVTFRGAATQTIGGTISPVTLKNLTILNPQGVVLGVSLNVSGTIDVQGDFDLKNYTIDLGTTGSLSNENETNHIIATNAFGTVGSGNGVVKATRIVSGAKMSNIAGLGIDIVPASTMGSTIITRGHKALQGDGSFSGNYGVFKSFIIEPTNYVTASINMKYFTDELNGHIDGNLELFQEVQYSAGGWTAPAYWAPVASINTAPWVSASTTSNLLPYYKITLGSQGSPLPIELINFNAIYNDEKVNLTWATASEINNAYFTIERSKDLVGFEKVGVINGAGNSHSTLNYESYDNKPYTGISYYRLTQTDFDGKSTMSNVVAVNINNTGKFLSFDVFPNPASKDENPSVRISSFEPETSVLVVVRDLLGQELYSKVIITDFSGNSLTAIDVEGRLPSGTYLIIGTSLNQTFNKHLIIH